MAEDAAVRELQRSLGDLARAAEQRELLERAEEAGRREEKARQVEEARWREEQERQRRELQERAAQERAAQERLQVSEKGEVLLRGVGTLQTFSPPNASVQWQPDGLTIHTKKWCSRSRIPRSTSRFSQGRGPRAPRAARGRRPGAAEPKAAPGGAHGGGLPASVAAGRGARCRAVEVLQPAARAGQRQPECAV